MWIITYWHTLRMGHCGLTRRDGLLSSWIINEFLKREERLILKKVIGASNDTRNGVWTVKTSKKWMKCHLKEKLMRQLQRATRIWEGKQVVGLGLREILTEHLQVNALSKCFYSNITNCLISFIPFLLFHNFTIWPPWNALVTGCFCFQTSSLSFTKKGETQNFHSLTMVCFQRLIEQETDDEVNTKIQSSIVKEKRT